MAGQRFRRVRRSALAVPRPEIVIPSGRQTEAITAAVMDWDIDKPTQYKHPLSTAGRMGWQTEAWDLLDRVGELRYYVGWRAASCSKVRLIASELDDEGKPTGQCSNTAVRDLVRFIGNDQLGAGQFIKRSVENLTVPGEVFQGIIYDDSHPDGQWLAFSRDEVRKTANYTTVEMPDGRDHKLVKGTDSFWKVWQPHPRRQKECDSPVRANMAALREIETTTKTISDAGKSRLLGNGIVFVPSEMSLPSSTSPIAAGQPGAPIELQGTPAVRELEELLYQVAQVSYDDDESFARMIPIFASVPGEMVKNVHHLKFDTELTDTAIKTRNDAIARLALGLDVSPERLLGLGSSTNHWSAWQIGDNDVQMHIAPVMEIICDALTKKVLHAMLSENDRRRYVVWYDTSELTADPDKSDDATDAFDRGVITADAYRKFLNLGDNGYDLSTIEGWQAWARDQIANEPTLITNLGALVPELETIEFPEREAIEASTEAAKNPPHADTTNEGDDPDTEGEDPGYDQGKRGRKEDVGSRITTPHDALVQVFVSRALELAGKRRRNIHDRAEKARLRGHRAHEFHRLMEPLDAAQIPKLIEGWDDTLEDDVLRVLGVEREDFAGAVRAEVRRQLTAPVITAS